MNEWLQHSNPRKHHESCIAAAASTPLPTSTVPLATITGRSSSIRMWDIWIQHPPKSPNRAPSNDVCKGTPDVASSANKAAT